jgi:uncharacterized protein YutE (UPF0331/DUF86 family)
MEARLMTDAELVAKKLAQVETYLHQLRTLARIDQLHSDVREERFICHTLQLALQAVLDVASHIVSDERLGEPQDLRELFRFLSRDGWIPEDLAESLRNMVGFRNILVHEYARVDLNVVEDVLRNRLADLDTFAAAVRQRLRR